MDIAYQTAIKKAAELFREYSEWSYNPEYLRGMCELIAEMYPLPNVPSDERTEQVFDDLHSLAEGK